MKIKNTNELHGFTEVRTKEGWYMIDLNETYSDIYVVGYNQDDYRDKEPYEILVDDILEVI